MVRGNHVGWDPVFRRDSSFDQILRRIAVARRDIIPATLGVSTVSSSRRASIAGLPPENSLLLKRDS